MNVSELISMLSKLPPDMELRKLNSRDDYKVDGSRDMGFKVVNGALYHIYDLPTDPAGVYLEEYVPIAPLELVPADDPETSIEYGTAMEDEVAEVKTTKRKRGEA